MGIESNNMAAAANTAVYKLMLNHIGQTTTVTTAADTVITGILEGVQPSFVTVRTTGGDAAFVVLGYIVSVTFPGI
ncbi:hypothetical protein PaecuDRAFT_1333 [Paenibacillus curdlanolyticus YK9]|uniref:Uncharacterized protein n=1 Tax=Paenibacillus curdlanolyticus YK9 TaxID=717606 RepID=E0I6R1_9BACL|nr:DUF2642 domain-containing protein [Paenibacillus curdlanolyticus]EFM11727.1 hypothetical protein PaecuDRAFT_1333 [Paenibacillus curdlanolyticus YK9]